MLYFTYNSGNLGREKDPETEVRNLQSETADSRDVIGQGPIRGVHSFLTLQHAYAVVGIHIIIWEDASLPPRERQGIRGYNTLSA